MPQIGQKYDPALRRPGRFDREIEIGVPNAEGRHEILGTIQEECHWLRIDLQELASELNGYTGADINALCRESAMKALRRTFPKSIRKVTKFPGHPWGYGHKG